MDQSYWLTAAWESCIDEALQIEAFEPRLKGFGEQIRMLRNGVEPCLEWLEEFSVDLKALEEIISALALQLHEISSEYDRCHSIQETYRIRSLALRLHTIAKGADNTDTQTIARVLRGGFREPVLSQSGHRLPKICRVDYFDCF